jgi:hypothetical protein
MYGRACVPRARNSKILIVLAMRVRLFAHMQCTIAACVAQCFAKQDGGLCGYTHAHTHSKFSINMACLWGSTRIAKQYDMQRGTHAHYQCIAKQDDMLLRGIRTALDEHDTLPATSPTPPNIHPPSMRM